MSNSIYRLVLELSDKTTPVLNNLNKKVEEVDSAVSDLQNSMSGLLAVVGSMAAGGGLISFLNTSVNAANQAANAQRMFQQAVLRTGVSLSDANAMVNTLAQRFQVSQSVIQEATKTLLNQGYAVEQVQQILTAYGASALSNGRDVGEAMKTGAQAVAFLRSELNEAAGITIDFGPVLDRFAKRVGTTTEKLSEAQKRQAIVNALMKDTRDDVEALDGLFAGYSGTLARFNSAKQKAAITIGSAFLPVFDAVVKSVTEAINAFNRLSPSVQSFLSVSTLTTGILATFGYGTVVAVAQLGKLVVAMRTAAAASRVLQLSLGWVGILSVAVGGLAGAFLTARDRATDWAERTNEAIASVMSGELSMDGFKKKLDEISKTFKDPEVRDFFKRQVEEIIKTAQATGKWGEALKAVEAVQKVIELRQKKATLETQKAELETQREYLLKAAPWLVSGTIPKDVPKYIADSQIRRYNQLNEGITRFNSQITDIDKQINQLQGNVNAFTSGNKPSNPTSANDGSGGGGNKPDKKTDYVAVEKAARTLASKYLPAVRELVKLKEKQSKQGFLSNEDLARLGQLEAFLKNESQIGPTTARAVEMAQEIANNELAQADAKRKQVEAVKEADAALDDLISQYQELQRAYHAGEISTQEYYNGVIELEKKAQELIKNGNLSVEKRKRAFDFTAEIDKSKETLKKIIDDSRKKIDDLKQAVNGLDLGSTEGIRRGVDLLPQINEILKNPGLTPAERKFFEDRAAAIQNAVEKTLLVPYDPATLNAASKEGQEALSQSTENILNGLKAGTLTPKQATELLNSAVIAPLDRAIQSLPDGPLKNSLLLMKKRATEQVQEAVDDLTKTLPEELPDFVKPPAPVSVEFGVELDPILNIPTSEVNQWFTDLFNDALKNGVKFTEEMSPELVEKLVSLYSKPLSELSPEELDLLSVFEKTGLLGKVLDPSVLQKYGGVFGSFQQRVDEAKANGELLTLTFEDGQEVIGGYVDLGNGLYQLQNGQIVNQERFNQLLSLTRYYYRDQIAQNEELKRQEAARLKALEEQKKALDQLRTERQGALESYEAGLATFEETAALLQAQQKKLDEMLAAALDDPEILSELLRQKNDILKALRTLEEKTQDFIEGLGNTLIEWVKRLSFGTEFGGKFAELLGILWKNLSGLIARFIEQVIKAADPAKVVSPDDVAKYLTGLLERLRAQFFTLLDFLGSVDWVQAAKDALIAVRDGLRSVAEQFKNGGLAQHAKTALIAVRDFVLDLGRQIEAKGGFLNFMADLGKSAADGVSAMLDKLDFSAFANIVTAIVEVIAFFAPYMESTLKPLNDAFSKLLGAVLLLVQPFTDLLVKALVPIIDVLTTVLAPVLSFLGMIFKVLAPVIYLLNSYFRIISAVLMSLIIPVLRLLFEPLKWFGVIITTLAIAIAEVINAIISIYNAIPFVDDIAKVDTAPLYESLDDLMNANLDTADTVKGLGDAAKDASEQLSNIPKGFKVALERFRATNPIGVPTQGNPFDWGSRPVLQSTSNTVFNGNITIVTDNPQEFFRKLQGEIRRNNNRSGGTPVARVRRYD